MSMAQTIRLAGICVGLATVGCVDRKFVVETNVDNAQVYVDNASIGSAPAYTPFEYYGDYTIRVVRPGYETVIKRQHIAAPWYAYPPFDFITEVLWPFNIHDTRRVYIELHPTTQSRTDDILNAAESLRMRGLALPKPDRPAEPRPPRNQPMPPPGPTIGPPVELPPGSPVPVPVPTPGPAPGVVPNVLPQ